MKIDYFPDRPWRLEKFDLSPVRFTRPLQILLKRDDSRIHHPLSPTAENILDLLYLGRFHRFRITHNRGTTRSNPAESLKYPGRQENHSCHADHFAARGCNNSIADLSAARSWGVLRRLTESSLSRTSTGISSKDFFWDTVSCFETLWSEETHSDIAACVEGKVLSKLRYTLTYTHTTHTPKIVNIKREYSLLFLNLVSSISYSCWIDKGEDFPTGIIVNHVLFIAVY